MVYKTLNTILFGLYLYEPTESNNINRADINYALNMISAKFVIISEYNVLARNLSTYQ